MHTGTVQTAQEFSETLHSGYKKMKHKPFMKQEVYKNNCIAINHMGDTTKHRSDRVQ